MKPRVASSETTEPPVLQAGHEICLTNYDTEVYLHFPSRFSLHAQNSDHQRSRECSVMGSINVEAEDLGTGGTGNIRERDFVGRDKNGLTQI
jgi:hypothetical protein